MIVYKVRVLKKSSNRNLKLILSTLVTTWPSNIAFICYRIGCTTVNFGWNQFRIMLYIVSKLLRTAIWSSCAVKLESEQTPCPWTGSISFATNFAANFGCDQFRIMPDIVSKLLRPSIQIWADALPRTGCHLSSAAVHKIPFRTCGFVPMLYFYLETPCRWSTCRVTWDSSWTAVQPWKFVSHEKHSYHDPIST